MGWRDVWYPKAMTAMRGLRGDGATGTDSLTMPLLQASDCLPILGQVVKALVSALTAQSRNNAPINGVALRSDILNDGNFDSPTAMFTVMGDATAKISLEDYVGGIGLPGVAWRRSTVIGGPTYEPFIASGTFDFESTALLGLCHQAVSDWQRAIDASAVILQNSATTDQVADSSLVDGFLAALRSLCSDLDVLGENPPPSMGDNIKGALKDSLHQTEEFIGKSAADISEELGKGAGNVAKGFFSQAGALSLVVAGLVIFLYLR